MKKSAVIALVLVFWTVDALAQSVNRKTELRGWSGTGQEIVVDAEMQGEVMVDGAARDFFYQSTEMYRADNGKFIRRFKKGTPPGFVHPDYAAARAATDAAKFLETAGLLEAPKGAQSPDGRWFIDVASTRETVPRGDAFRCKVHDKAMLFDEESQKLFVIYEHIEEGEKAAGRADARCPTTQYKVHWHPGSTDWAMVRVVHNPTGDDEWNLLPGRTSKLDDYPEAPFQPADHAAKLFSSSAEPDVIKGREALFDGNLEAAKKTLGESETTSAERVMLLALVFALEGEKKAARSTARKAFRNSPRDAYYQGLLAAVYAATDDARRAKKHVSRAIEEADSYDVLARIGALFMLVDLSVANQVLIHALSHETAEDIDTTDGYVALSHSLMDARQLKAARDLLDRFDEEPTEVRLARARLALEEKRFDEARTLASKALFTEPGRCMAYRVFARAIAPERPADSLGHFRAAVVCDPTESESLFLLAGLELEAGRLERARQLFGHYLERAYPRRSDELRDAQRQHAEKMVERLSREGALLTQAACRPLAGARLCQGTVYNQSENVLEGVTVKVWDASKKRARKAVSKVDVEPIPPGESRTFGVRVEGKDKLDLSAGRNDEEHRTNRMRAR